MTRKKKKKNDWNDIVSEIFADLISKNLSMVFPITVTECTFRLQITGLLLNLNFYPNKIFTEFFWFLKTTVSIVLKQIKPSKNIRDARTRSWTSNYSSIISFRRLQISHFAPISSWMTLTMILQKKNSIKVLLWRINPSIVSIWSFPMFTLKLPVFQRRFSLEEKLMYQ